MQTITIVEGGAIKSEALLAPAPNLRVLVQTADEPLQSFVARVLARVSSLPEGCVESANLFLNNDTEPARWLLRGQLAEELARIVAKCPGRLGQLTLRVEARHSMQLGALAIIDKLRRLALSNLDLSVICTEPRTVQPTTLRKARKAAWQQEQRAIAR